MATPAVSSWLPGYQDHAFFTTAHIDGIINNLSTTLEHYQRDEPVQLARRFTETEDQLVLEGIRPLPQAAARLFADALNQARNSVEHALFAKVLHRLNRPLTPDESRALEIPAFDKREKFEQWAKNRHRCSIGLFAPGDDLYERVLRLQPFQRQDPHHYPLRLLAEHTNFAKHREPTVAFTRVARFDFDSKMMGRPVGERDVVEVGDVLAAVPIGKRELFSVWPEVAVQRPHTGEWQTLMREAGEIADWVRRQALPFLNAGETDLPPIPPALDITVVYDSTAAAWLAAGETSAAKRMQNRIGGEQLRGTVLVMMVGLFGAESRRKFGTWLDGMDDETVMEEFWDVLQSASRGGDFASYYRAAEKWAAEAGVQPPDMV
ncbi:hypothetical protein E3T23_02110 [Cryobacterium cheniae]|uniref:Uncharacterized protein n=1 Tax=Cryobacterium cheniae TaxID=1259262 RepID=A0A4R8XVX5_9MICO|nr:hypothetical protein [Cryobacterium cheniae]TFC83369.1 hypothetical protein E3T23_02110 [Cryobacterium cheniae]